MTRLIDPGRTIARLQFQASDIAEGNPRAAAVMVEAANLIGTLSDALDDQSRRQLTVARRAYRAGRSLGAAGRVAVPVLLLAMAGCAAPVVHDPLPAIPATHEDAPEPTIEFSTDPRDQRFAVHGLDGVSGIWTTGPVVRREGVCARADNPCGSF